MSAPETHIRLEAIQRFQRKVFIGQLDDLVAWTRDRRSGLIKFDVVSRRLHLRQQANLGAQMVPLNHIVGSVGRHQDFTRRFLPRNAVNQERWVRIDTALHSMEGVPPVELYRIGAAYFVEDGNHRVSVARANGFKDIEAYVKDYKSPIPLTLADFRSDRWLIKAEYLDFLAQTGLDRLRPDHEILFSEPERYAALLRHIEVHRYLHNQNVAAEGRGRFWNWEEAVASWYDQVYLPVVEAIRQSRLPYRFPGSTEGDLYLWVAQHREELAWRYELAPLSPELAIATFAHLYSGRLVGRVWRELRLAMRRLLHLDRIPAGMSAQEFRLLRARHDAGEITLAEAQQRLRYA